tara:strand:- start:240 stop:659 length:420 start_codon:yes stop_codon:yes gene_type:complete
MEYGEIIKQYLIGLLAIFRKRVRGSDFTLSQILIISSIPHGGIDMSSLSEKIGVDNSTTTRLLDRLIKAELIKKSKNISDKRITLVSLTEKGELLSHEIEKKIDTIGSEIVKYIPLKKREDIKESLLSFHWILLKYQNS